VLVVDDDASIREALHLILDDKYSVLDAARGRAALSIVCAQRVDLVLLDILMPEVDGIEILQELKAQHPDLPVIMITAVKAVRTAVAAMKLGAWDFLTKPFQEEELLATIHRALVHRALPKAYHPGNVTYEHKAQLPRPHRILVASGDLGFRATLAVALTRVASVETSGRVIEGLNCMLRFRPTAVILNTKRSSTEVTPFLRALHAQLPACPVLVISDDGYLGGSPENWETLSIRVVMQPPVDPRDLLNRVGAMVSPGIDDKCGWPSLSPSVSEAVRCISTRFNEGLTVERLAQVAKVSASRLAHLFRAEMGMSIKSYLTRVRIVGAKDLLAHTDEKLEDIAARLGFCDMFHLSRVFQRVTGQPPSSYRRSLI
jgi:DNA-binding response OmpR family regulator